MSMNQLQSNSNCSLLLYYELPNFLNLKGNEEQTRPRWEFGKYYRYCVTGGLLNKPQVNLEDRS